MKICDFIKLKNGDIISFVGAGGKTTMMFKLAEELRHNNKVLVTTTTKIYVPLEEKYDFISTDNGRFAEYITMNQNGIYVLGLGINKENKILGLSGEELNKLAPCFDYLLIEADGAKEKQLKACNECEPVIYLKTTKTVGIIDIQSFGMVINEANVHRSALFCEITGAKEGNTVKLEHLSSLILHPKGLFKAAEGEKILYINKVERPNDLIFAKSLVNQVNLKGQKLIDNIIFGSLKNEVYFSENGIYP